ncbi:Fe-S protein assembly chaperone HscA [Silvibacterium dinghuense]|uniref:Chaperone protein DnaK n=1 Tax=Silvibacterium dinghuense TaxID=1560006 RepID=A0A4Q1S8R9_9BACT|nr:Fe-S protein assembly chaperone HscA [Silvibacterium dinghuense]RXS93331.1 Fe-S protein assembly chaperone HscA [Silvibacterium dinghuense]GGH04963.1 chaperone protein DnaK [Silvibacterium dinghuense]
MNLTQIDGQNGNTPSRIVGIDLGTTNSLVAFMQGDHPVVIPGEDGTNLVPSVVAIPEPRKIVVGNPAHTYLATTPERVIYSAKRLMGRGLEDVQDELKLFPFQLASDIQPGEVLRIQLGEQQFTPPEISAYVLRQLKKNAERYFGAPVTKAVVTVPAYFNDAQRQATKDAGRIAGLEILRLVNEPTAAALAYGLDRQKEGVVAVYDLGGGTFDVSILKLHEGIFEVIATNGDTHLGGDDIDNLLIAIALDDIRGELGVDLRGHAEAIQAIRKSVIEAKIALSSADAAKLDVTLPGGQPYQREITREQFEQIIRPVIDRTVGPCRQALKDAGVTPEQIDEVVLVGGSTRIPLVRQLTSELFHLAARGKKPHIELNPDEVVALGAAVQANILEGGSKATEDMLLLDVTPLSLGIEALGGVVAKIIQRNSTIPASATEHFTTGVDGQTNVAIHVVQGERELAKDCRSLARFDLKGIPPMSAGLPRIEVKFLIDANGILHVSAREQRSSKAAEIDVKPTYGLSDEQVETMILESFDYAEQDIQQRQLIEARNEADTILAAIDKAKWNPVWQQLTEAEQLEIASLSEKLAMLKDGEDLHALRDGTHALDASTRRVAELMMDNAVASAIGGQTMESAGESLGQGPTAPHPFAPADIASSKEAK